jgi:hypothetical protein
VEGRDRVKTAANTQLSTGGSHPDEVERPTDVREESRVSRRESRVSPKLLIKLAEHVSDRDRQIAVDCYEHHVLTTDQLRRLHFKGLRTTAARLQLLYDLRVLDRFRPKARPGEGSHPYHWILDEAGALLVADRKGIDRGALHYRHEDGLRLASSRNLTHHIEVNEFFTRLAVEANAGGGELREWYGVRTLAHMLAGRVVPDAYGVLAMPNALPLHILLELDRGTEAGRVLREKAARYAEILPRSGLRDLDPFVVLAVPSARRIGTARAATATTAVPISVVIWDRQSARSVLAIVRHCASDARSQ